MGSVGKARTAGNAQISRRPLRVEDERAAEPVRTPSRYGAQRASFALVGGQDFVERGADRRRQIEERSAGGEAALSGADTLFLAQSLAQDLTADTAQLAHKSHSYGEAADAYLQVERSAMRGQPGALMFGLEIQVDRSV